MILAFKLLMTPFFITLVTLVGRRWGPGVSGWLIGIPFTSGPVSIILAMEYGNAFAIQTVPGMIGGQTAVCIFALVYALASRKMNWLGSSLTAVGGFFLFVLGYNFLSLSFWLTFGILLLAIVVIYNLLPEQEVLSNSFTAPRWDLPARIFMATLFVYLLTTFAETLGSQLSGLISPFPLYGVILVAFTHYQLGRESAINFLRGYVLGSLAFGSFFLVVVLCLNRMGMIWTYSLAALTAVCVNGASLLIARSRRRAEARRAAAGL